jgi:hypothetical protein
MQRPLVGGLARLAALAVAASLIGVAACGGPLDGTPAPTPTPTSTLSAAGLEFPPGLTEEQKAAVLRIADPGDPTKLLATLVEARTLTADELALDLRGDASFAALEADAVARGFGRIAAAVDLVYDNGVTVTAAPLGTCSADVLRLAYRSSAPKSHYLLAELDQVAGRLTTWDENGTVTLDLATGKSSAVESPDAQHSCSFLHCFNTAMEVAASAPLYGLLSEKVCKACGTAVTAAWIAVTPVGEALLGVPCVACLATLTAAFSASLWVCIDDPCELCMSDACGETGSGSDPPILCASYGFPPDPETGSTAGRYWADGAYVCEGIELRHEYFWFGDEIPDYSDTQCVFRPDVTGPVQSCPYGCASPAPGDSASRTCQAAPSVCDPATCKGTTVTAGTQTCSLRPDGTYAATQPVQVNGCVDVANGQTCGVVETRITTTKCGPCGCNGTSCRCLADHALNDPVCSEVNGRSEVTQNWTHCEWIAASQTCREAIVPRVTPCGTAGCSSDGKSCGTATQCDPATCQGEEVLSSVCILNAGGRTGTVTQVKRRYLGCNAAGTECLSVDSQPTLPCIAGCAAGGQFCASPGGGRGDGCVPSECARPDEPVGDPRCVFRPDDQKWILERDYRSSACNPAGGGDSATCEQTTITRLDQMCPAGCGADLRSCAPAGSVPAAPSEFDVRQRPEGTAFSWRDNATNETGYHIFFGSRSLGEPAVLLTDVKGVDAVGMIIPWKRTGGATCWELYAYNAVGESAPARYCLPE